MMKKFFTYGLAWLMATGMSYAQDDDVYFVPSQSQRTQQGSARQQYQSDYDYIDADEAWGSYDAWADGRLGGIDVDAYNRRAQVLPDSVVLDSLSYLYGYEDGQEDCSYTSRIVRFHSPRLGIYVASPYYYDYLYDPWFDYVYDPWYDG